MSAWVDYRKLRETVDFKDVLDYYRIEYKRKGTQVTAFCPLPTHEGHQNSPAFSASLEKNVFRCFGCGVQGNILDFIARMEGLDPQNPQEFRRAAIIAKDRFGPDGSMKRHPDPVPPKENAGGTARIVLGNAPLPTHLVNEPLDFELKNLDPKSIFLRSRGLTDRTISHFGLGYCTKGHFSGRIVIPLHDMKGRLIGYAGRLAYEDAVDEENPKYLFPPKRERNGVTLEFAKSLFVYNGHRIAGPEQDLIIVQGFGSVWWLWQNGHQNVVSIMGSRCSVDQAKAIVSLLKPTGRAWLLTDGNKIGEQCAADLFFDLGPSRFCRWIKLPQGKPGDYSAEEIDEMLAWSIGA